MILRTVRCLGLLVVFALMISCASAAKQHSNLPSTQERKMTLGIVQKEIHQGMSQADVAEALGSPNIVTKDSQSKETWIYDKIATEAAYSQNHGFFTLLLFGVESQAGASSSTQRTLTVVIKFDDAEKVDGLTYHSSQF